MVQTQDIKYRVANPRWSFWSKPVSQQYFLGTYPTKAPCHCSRLQNPSQIQTINPQLKTMHTDGHTFRCRWDRSFWRNFWSLYRTDGLRREREVLCGNVLTPGAAEDITSSPPLCTWPRLDSFFMLSEHHAAPWSHSLQFYKLQTCLA